jgi:tetratricopeptide (TPR) repeat protein
VAGALAVAGRPFSEYDLGGVTKLSTAELAAAIRELEEAGFVRRSGANLAFAHEQYLASILEHIDAPLRRTLHKRLATALVRMATTRSMARYEVAQHLESAGQPKQALAQALLAAGHAASVGALRERSAALELADRVATEDRADIVLDLAACYLHLKEFDKLIGVCAAARRIPQASIDLELNVDFFEIAAAYDSGRASLGRTCEELVALLAQGRAFRHEFEARTMLMRTADKSGQHLLARRAARDLRKRAEADNAIDAAAFRLLSTGYIAAKHYWPGRALPLLERALLEAQRAHNWGVELTCRDGIGAVLKQLGRYQASVQHIQFGLALARKTLNPQAEALALNNLAVTEIAMGNMTSADRHLAEMAQIDATFPAWPFRAYRLVNQGVLRLLQGAAADARVHFVDAHDLSRDRELWSVLLFACGGIAMCAVRRGDYVDLKKWCEALKKYSGGREDALSDAALVESAVAWNTCVNTHNPAGALSRLRESIRRSARTDIDHWLALRMEEIRLREWIYNRPERERRQELADECEVFGAEGIARQAVSLP